MSNLCSLPHEFLDQITMMNDVLLSKTSKQWSRIAPSKNIIFSNFLIYISHPFPSVICFYFYFYFCLLFSSSLSFLPLWGSLESNPPSFLWAFIFFPCWDLTVLWHDSGLDDQFWLIQYFDLFRLNLQGIGKAEIGSGMEPKVCLPLPIPVAAYHSCVCFCSTLSPFSFLYSPAFSLPLNCDYLVTQRGLVLAFLSLCLLCCDLSSMILLLTLLMSFLKVSSWRGERFRDIHLLHHFYSSYWTTLSVVRRQGRLSTRKGGMQRLEEEHVIEPRSEGSYGQKEMSIGAEIVVKGVDE